jgi:molecular chaperone GrpE
MEENKENTEKIVTPLDELLTKNNELESKLALSEDKYLRLYSDFENWKKRATKEKDEIKNNTKVQMITSILDMDNDISIAVKNIKDETTKSSVKLISNKLESFLKSQGIETIQTNTYNEELHEVISVLEIGESKVIDVVSKGYTIDGKPFRYPKIVLGK